MAKLGFFLSIARALEGFLTFFQSNKCLMPFLYEHLSSLLRNLLRRFVKPSALTDETSVIKMLKIDINPKSGDLKLYSQVDIGFAATASCKSLKELDALQFRKDCRLFLSTLCMKLVEKCPLSFKLVRGASSLSPQVMLGKKSIREDRVKSALEALVEKKWISPSNADVVKRQYISFCKEKAVFERLSHFDKEKDSLDHVLMDLVDSSSSDDLEMLKQFIKQILVLFHSTAVVERSFSNNKEYLVENLLEQSLVAQRYVSEGVTRAGGVNPLSLTTQ